MVGILRSPSHGKGWRSLSGAICAGQRIEDEAATDAVRRLPSVSLDLNSQRATVMRACACMSDRRDRVRPVRDAGQVWLRGISGRGGADRATAALDRLPAPARD